MAVVVAGLLPALGSAAAAVGPGSEPPAAQTTSAGSPADRVNGLWSPAAASRAQGVPSGATRRVDPSDAAAYSLDGAQLRALLSRAPDEGSRAAAGAPVTITVPAPNGELARFAIADSPILEPKIAAAHPEISTFAGRGIDDPAATIRLDLTPMGFHASVREPGGQNTWYVDPAYNGDDSVYLSYFGKDLPEPEGVFVEHDADAHNEVAKSLGVEAEATVPVGAEVRRRTYRLALLTDPSYADYFGTENVLAEKVTLMNRVNQIYNDDLAVRMVLIDESDTLNLDTVEKATGVNGPCGAAGCFTPEQLAGCSGSTLNRNRVVLGQLVGAGAYDIGHIGLGISGGGVAGLGVVGGSGKARGCTGLPQPEGDFYAVDYVAHEMGHQFSGNHTFNGTQWNCSGGNRSPGSSVEPGSGSSVMAYAGICQQDNIQPHSDPYFSQRSHSEMSAFVGAALPAINEVQTVSLRGFDTDGEAFVLTLGGLSTGPIVRGAGYDLVSIDAAVEAITDGTVSVTGFGGAATLDDTGFQVTFDGGGHAATNVASLAISSDSAGVSGFVGETSKGGPVDNGGTTVENLGNHAPVVSAPSAKSLPIRTPFALTGSATDSDGDTLTYTWEQNDRGSAAGTALVSNTKVDGPLFRQFGTYADVTPAGTLQSPSPGENAADGNPTRVFPDLAQIVANNTNADTGTCPAAPAPPASGGATNVPVDTVECYAEFLPTAAYLGTPLAQNDDPSLHFRLTARDGRVDGGGVGFADVTLTLDPTVGPFRVSSRNSPGTAALGTRGETLTWAVANTGTPQFAERVTISLSTDGGRTFPRVLAADTPNDGSELIHWPNVATDQARVRIEAVGNYFFDVNNVDFAIVPDPPALDTTITGGPAEGSFVVADPVRFGYRSTVPGSTYRCTLNGTPRGCAPSGVAFGSPATRTHVFGVAAVDPDGNADATPATRSFTVPVNDRGLTNLRGWVRRSGATAYRGTFSTATTRGATLTRQVRDVRSLALVAGKGRGYGDVRVFLDGRLLERVSLAAKQLRAKQVIAVASFAVRRSGAVRIVAADDRPVRIEGLGVATR